MNPTERRRGAGISNLRVLARWVLLGAIVVAVFALHGLTAENDEHAVPVVSSSASAVTAPFDAGSPDHGAAAWAGSAVLHGVEQPDGGGDWLLAAGCVLFLVVGSAVALVLALLRRRAPESALSVSRRWPGDGRGAPPGPGAPRLALCVSRI